MVGTTIPTRWHTKYTVYAETDEQIFKYKLIEEEFGSVKQRYYVIIGYDVDMYKYLEEHNNIIKIPELKGGKPILGITDYAFNDKLNIEGTTIGSTTYEHNSYIVDARDTVAKYYEIKGLDLSENLQTIGKDIVVGSPTFVTYIRRTDEGARTNEGIKDNYNSWLTSDTNEENYSPKTWAKLEKLIQDEATFIGHEEEFMHQGLVYYGYNVEWVEHSNVYQLILDSQQLKLVDNLGNDVTDMNRGVIYTGEEIDDVLINKDETAKKFDTTVTPTLTSTAKVIGDDVVIPTYTYLTDFFARYENNIDVTEEGALVTIYSNIAASGAFYYAPDTEASSVISHYEASSRFKIARATVVIKHTEETVFSEGKHWSNNVWTGNDYEITGLRKEEQEKISGSIRTVFNGSDVPNESDARLYNNQDTDFVYNLSVLDKDNNDISSNYIIELDFNVRIRPKELLVYWDNTTFEYGDSESLNLPTAHVNVDAPYKLKQPLIINVYALSSTNELKELLITYKFRPEVTDADGNVITKAEIYDLEKTDAFVLDKLDVGHYAVIASTDDTNYRLLVSSMELNVNATTVKLPTVYTDLIYNGEEQIPAVTQMPFVFSYYTYVDDNGKYFKPLPENYNIDDLESIFKKIDMGSTDSIFHFKDAGTYYVYAILNSKDGKLGGISNYRWEDYKDPYFRSNIAVLSITVQPRNVYININNLTDAQGNEIIKRTEQLTFDITDDMITPTDEISGLLKTYENGVLVDGQYHKLTGTITFTPSNAGLINQFNGKDENDPNKITISYTISGNYKGNEYGNVAYEKGNYVVQVTGGIEVFDQRINYEAKLTDEKGNSLELSYLKPSVFNSSIATEEYFGYTTTYSKAKSYDFEIVTNTPNCEIKYFINDVEVDTIPTYKNAGVYVIYYEITAEGYRKAVGSITIEIKKASYQGLVNYANPGELVFDGQKHNINPTVTEGQGEGDEDIKVQYYRLPNDTVISDNNLNMTELLAGRTPIENAIDAGVYYVLVRVTSPSGNFEDDYVEALHFTIKQREINLNLEINVGYYVDKYHIYEFNYVSAPFSTDNALRIRFMLVELTNASLLSENDSTLIHTYINNRSTKYYVDVVEMTVTGENNDISNYKVADDYVLKVNLMRQEADIRLKNDLSKVFDGKVVDDIIVETNSTGRIDAQYYIKDENDSFVEINYKPYLKGTYGVRVSVEGDENTLSNTSGIYEFNITPSILKFKYPGTFGYTGSSILGEIKNRIEITSIFKDFEFELNPVENDDEISRGMHFFTLEITDEYKDSLIFELDKFEYNIVFKSLVVKYNNQKLLASDYVNDDLVIDLETDTVVSADIGQVNKLKGTIILQKSATPGVYMYNTELLAGDMIREFALADDSIVTLSINNFDIVNDDGESILDNYEVRFEINIKLCYEEATYDIYLPRYVANMNYAEVTEEDKILSSDSGHNYNIERTYDANSYALMIRPTVAGATVRFINPTTGLASYQPLVFYNAGTYDVKYTITGNLFETVNGVIHLTINKAQANFDFALGDNFRLRVDGTYEKDYNASLTEYVVENNTGFDVPYTISFYSTDSFEITDDMITTKVESIADVKFKVGDDGYWYGATAYDKDGNPTSWAKTNCKVIYEEVINPDTGIKTKTNNPINEPYRGSDGLWYCYYQTVGLGGKVKSGTNEVSAKSYKVFYKDIEYWYIVGNNTGYEVIRDENNEIINTPTVVDNIFYIKGKYYANVANPDGVDELGSYIYRDFSTGIEKIRHSQVYISNPYITGNYRVIFNVKDTANYDGQTIDYYYSIIKAPFDIMYNSNVYDVQEYTGQPIKDPNIALPTNNAERKFEYYIIDTVNNTKELIATNEYVRITEPDEENPGFYKTYVELVSTGNMPVDILEDGKLYMVAITVKSNGNYTETYEEHEFAIVSRNVSIIWENTTTVYTGQPQLPRAYIVTLQGEEVEQTVKAYDDNDNEIDAITAGTYKVKVVGSHSQYAFRNTVLEDFTITKADLYVTYRNPYYTYNGQKAKVEFTENSLDAVVSGLATTDSIKVNLSTKGREINTYDELSEFEYTIDIVNSLTNNSALESYNLILDFFIDIRNKYAEVHFEDEVETFNGPVVTYDYNYGKEITLNVDSTTTSPNVNIEYFIDSIYTTYNKQVFTNAGTYNIRYKVSGSGYETDDERYITVVINKIDYEIELVNSLDKEYDGQPVYPVIEITNVEYDKPIPINYEFYNVNNKSVRILSPTEIGSYILRVSVASIIDDNGNENYNYTVKEFGPFSISSTNRVFTLINESLNKVYDGEPIDIKFDYTGRTRTELVEKEITYTDQSGEHIGTGTVAETVIDDSALHITYYEEDGMTVHVGTPVNAGKYYVRYDIDATDSFASYTSVLYEINIEKANIYLGNYNDETGKVMTVHSYDGMPHQFDVSTFKFLANNGGSAYYDVSSQYNNIIKVKGNVSSISGEVGNYYDINDFIINNNFKIVKLDELGNETEIDVTDNYDVNFILYLAIIKAEVPENAVTADDVAYPYDSRSHQIIVNVDQTLIVGNYYITYSEDNNEFVPSVSYMASGEYTIYYKVAFDNYNDYYGSATLTIEKAQQVGQNVTIVLPDSKEITYQGGPINDFVVNRDSTGAVTYKYYRILPDESEEELTSRPKDVGNYKVRVTVEADANYLEATEEETFRIVPYIINIRWIGQTIYGYSGSAQIPTAYRLSNNYDNADVVITTPDVDGYNLDPNKIKVGNYRLVAVANNDNYIIDPTNDTFDYSITVKQVYRPSDITVDYTKAGVNLATSQYDVYSIVRVEGNTEVNVDVTSTIINAGIYKVTLRLTDTTNMMFVEANGDEIIGDVTINVEIKPINLETNSKVTVNALSNAPYTGQPQTPAPYIKFNGSVVLAENYDVTYENNVNITTDASPAYAIVTGKGNFTGTIRLTFKITSDTLFITENAEGIEYYEVSKTSYKQAPHVEYIKNIRSVVAGVHSQTTVKDFINMFAESQRTKITVYDQKGKKISAAAAATTYVGTGFKVTLLNDKKKVCDTIYVTVYGDFDSDGVIGASDYMILSDYLAGFRTLNNEYYLATNLDRSGNAPDGSTIILLGRHINQEIDIEAL